MTVDLFAQSPPIELHERVLLRDLAHHAFRDSRAVSEPRQVQLPHFASPAHIVHQVEGIPFAANESHDDAHPATSNVPVVYFTSTTAFNMRFILSRESAPKALTLSLTFSLKALHLHFPQEDSQLR
jgi:hypothetical protein